MADITTSTLKVGGNNLILRDADAQAKVAVNTQDISGLKEDLADVTDILTPESSITFEQGTLNSTNGAMSASTTRIRSADFFSCDDVSSIIIDSAYMINVFWYTQNAHGTFVSPSTGFISTSSFDISANKPTTARYFKIAVRYASGTSVSITPSDVADSDIYMTTSVIEQIQQSISDLQKKPTPFTTEMQAICGIKKAWDISSSASGSCFATKDGVTQQWTFNVGADDNLTDAAWYRRVFNPDTLEFANNSTAGRHSLGHVNSCSYNSSKDAFICGNGSGDYTLAGKLYLIENAFSKTNFLIEDALVIDFADYGKKPNAIWGDENNGAYNVIFVITNDGYDIYRVMLGEDSNDLGTGTLQKTTGFNGTYKILNHWEYGTLKEDYDNVVQGAFYYDNRVFWGFGHTTGIIPIHWVELLANGEVKTGGINYYSAKTDGSPLVRSICSVANVDNMAFCIFNNKTYMLLV